MSEIFSSDAIELIIARLEVADGDIVFSSLDNKEKNITRDEMIKHVRNCDKIGREYIETQMNFLRSLSDGSLMKKIAAAT